MNTGIDIPSDSGPHVAQIKNAGIDFVARYYRKPSSHWPPLSASEARLLSSSDLEVVAVWESASDSASYFTRLAGLDDATTAYHQASRIGQPAGSAIYFAVDFDASGREITGPIDDYFRGVAAGFAAAGGDSPDYNVGIYGSGATCQALLQAGLADYTWLAVSSGWAGYKSFTKWSIKQGKALTSLPFDHDSDQAQDDFGGFQVP